MNLIKQLQESKRWEDFVEWYSTSEFRVPQDMWIHGDKRTIDVTIDFEFFLILPLAFQKGVFEKFIFNQGYWIRHDPRMDSFRLIPIGPYVMFQEQHGSFERLLLNFFNKDA